MEPCLDVQNISKYFYTTRGLINPKTTIVKAVDGVSLSIESGGTLGLVGESGCGKTTLARLVLRVMNPTSGRILFNGEDIINLDVKAMSILRRQIQMVFQNPYSSLNPRMKIREIVGEPLIVHMKMRGHELRERVTNILDLVGLSEYYVDRFPHQFSGGQRQRIAIARALATSPALLILDEPTSSLDVSVQAQILTLLKELQSRLGLTYLFISHNLGVVKYMSKRIATMYKGKIVEVAETEEIFREPLHPYTRTLLAAIPIARRGHRVSVAYRPETQTSVESSSVRGCNYQPRCPYATDICRQKEPELINHSTNHEVACFLYSNKQ